MPKAKAEYYPKREATLFDWLAIPVSSIIVLVAMMSLGNTVVAWFARIAMIVLLVGVAMNYLGPINVRVEHSLKGGVDATAIFLSDVHYGLFTRPWLRGQLIREICKIGKIQYVFWGGDYVGLKGRCWTEAFIKLVEAVREVLPEAEMFACAGGHEVECPWKVIAKVFCDNDVHREANSWVVSRDGELAVWIHGNTEHPSWYQHDGEEPRDWWQKMGRDVVKMRRSASTLICLCHNPADIPARVAADYFDLVLSGHLHHGGRRSLKSLKENGDSTPQIISAGLGAAAEFFGRGLWPCRFTRPQVIVIKMKNGMKFVDALTGG